MTMGEMFEALVEDLKKSWKVNIGPQEHLALENEVVVDIQDVELDVETPGTYVCILRVGVSFLGRDRKKVLENLERMIPVVDAHAYKIEDVSVSVPGEMMIVTISVAFREVINV